MELRRRKPTALSPSNSMLVPYVRRHLSGPPPPKIPAGWGVEEVPRRKGSHVDRYYYEPGTGKKFRSIREVDDYLNGGNLGYRGTRSSPRKLTYNSPKYRKMIMSGGKLLRLGNEVDQSHLSMVPYGRPSGTTPFVLPDGWVVEEVPRRFKQSWAPDKYYYEPGTGRKFRSLAAVERHLAELEENAPLSEALEESGPLSEALEESGPLSEPVEENAPLFEALEETTPLSKALEEIKENIPLSKVFKIESLTKNSKKKAPEENAPASPFVGPPMEVKWVIASPQGDAWDPYVSGELISDDVKKEWANRFTLFMNQGNNWGLAEDDPDGYVA